MSNDFFYSFNNKADNEDESLKLNIIGLIYWIHLPVNEDRQRTSFAAGHQLVKSSESAELSH